MFLSFLFISLCANSSLFYLWRPPTNSASNVITCMFCRVGVPSPSCRNSHGMLHWEIHHHCHHKHYPTVVRPLSPPLPSSLFCPLSHVSLSIYLMLPLLISSKPLRVLHQPTPRLIICNARRHHLFVIPVYLTPFDIHISHVSLQCIQPLPPYKSYWHIWLPPSKYSCHIARDCACFAPTMWDAIDHLQNYPPPPYLFLQMIHYFQSPLYPDNSQVPMPPVGTVYFSPPHLKDLDIRELLLSLVVVLLIYCWCRLHHTAIPVVTAYLHLTSSFLRIYAI